MTPQPIDLDSEAIQFEGHWYTRDELARRIKAMLDAGDFAVGKPSLALEALTTTLSSLRTLAFRVVPEMADALNQAASKTGRSVGGVIRDALGDYLSMPSAQEAERSSPRAAGPAAPGRKQTDPEVPIVIGSGPVMPISSDLKVTQQMQVPSLLAGPPQLKAAQPHGQSQVPSVVVDKSAIVTEPVTAAEAASAVNLTAKKKDEETVERRWFGG